MKYIPKVCHMKNPIIYVKYITSERPYTHPHEVHRKGISNERPYIHLHPHEVHQKGISNERP